MKIKGYGCTFEILMALLPYSYGLVREGAVIAKVKSVGVGCAWALWGPSECSFPTNMGGRNILSLEAAMLV